MQAHFKSYRCILIIQGCILIVQVCFKLYRCTFDTGVCLVKKYIWYRCVFGTGVFHMVQVYVPHVP